MKIAKGLRVKMKVELSVVGGAQLEKSTVEYIQGGGTMLPGLETVLAGLENGAKRDGVIVAKEAFGNPAMHPVKKIPRGEFPKEASLKPGDRFTAKGAAGAMDVILQVEKVTDVEVECRLVHPLHDKDIAYVVEVIQVSDPRPPPMPGQAVELDLDPEP